MEILGYFAAVFTASTMVPQIVKSIRTKKVRDVSTFMLVCYICNSGLWVAYGVSIGATPLAIADCIAFFAGITQFYLKRKYYKKHPEVNVADAINHAEAIVA